MPAKIKILIIILAAGIVLAGGWWVWENQKNNEVALDRFCASDNDCKYSCCGCINIKENNCKCNVKLIVPCGECKCLENECKFIECENQTQITKEVTISADKTEYERGEPVKITIWNTANYSIRVFFPYGIERLQEEEWIEIPTGACHCTEVKCDIAGPILLKPGEKYEDVWYQTEVVCNKEPYLLNPVAGKYRVKIAHIEENKFISPAYKGEKNISYSRKFLILPQWFDLE